MKPAHADRDAARIAEAARLAQTGRLADAEALCRSVLAKRAKHPAALHILGMVMLQTGRAGEAAAQLGAARKLQPDNPHLMFAHGNALAASGRMADAAEAFAACVARDPHAAPPRAQLGLALAELGRLDEAIAAFRAAEARGMRDPLLLRNLGNALFGAGHAHAAAAAYGEAARMLPPDGTGVPLHDAGGNSLAPASRFALEQMRLMLLQYDDAIAAPALAEAHRAWGAALAARVPPLPQAAVDRDPERCLRVGLVGNDFGRHAVASSLLAPLAAVDRARVAPVIVRTGRREDDLTPRFRALAADWIDAAGVDDATLAARLRDARIDILVDLAGHSASNRLRLFQLRPAPVQATWLGYPGTTGSTAIDWRLGDAVCDPPEEDAASSERVLRLPGIHCYAPDPDAPEVAPPPALTVGTVTFGSCNTLAKISPATLALWGDVLAAVPGACLLIKAPIPFTPGMQQHFVQALAARGVDPARIACRGKVDAHRDHLAVYEEIDLALDTVPYNGTTTTCDALWMGVPVIALRGDRPAARTSESLLRQVGLGEFVAADRAGAVALAAGWARRLDDLAALRAALRARMAASPLCDATGFARRLEAAVRAMWHDRIART